LRKTLSTLVAIPLSMLLSCHPQPKAVVIGIALTSTNHPSVELAAKEINESGGIRGVPLQLVGLDWKVVAHFEAADILKWANDFAQNPDLVAVIGHSDSASTLSAAAFYNQHQVPQIVTIATNPAITNIGGWTYRLCVSDATQGARLAQYAVQDWGKKSIAVFYVNDQYGKGLTEVFETEVRRLGARVLSTRMHRNILQNDDKSMIEASLANLKVTDRPDLFVLFQRIEAADWTIKAIREAGLSTDILGGDSLARPDFVRSDERIKEKIRVSQFYLPAKEDSLAMRFLESHRSITGSEPDYGPAFAYDAVYLVRDAVAKNGFTRQGVKAYLDQLIEQRVQMRGVGGAYTLGSDHDARRPIFIVEARNGRYELLKTLTQED
jgi:branched-chain amino acid transport system substrate-binding protein